MKRLKWVTHWQALPAFCLLLAMTVASMLLIPYFFTQSFIGGLFQVYAATIIITLGQAIVITGGAIDLSLGTIISLVNVVIVVLVGGHGWGMFPSILAGMGAGMLCGVLNGFCVGILRMNPLLTTFATSWIYGGAALWLMPYVGMYAIPFTFSDNYRRFVLSVPISLWVILAVFLVCILAQRTAPGRQLYAVGTDMKRAYASGIPVERNRFFSYVFSAFTACVGGLCITGAIGSGDPNIGAPLNLQSIAACVIGGVALSGGVGTVTGALFASVFLSVVFSTVLAVGISPYYQNLTYSIIILASIVLPSAFRYLRGRMKKTPAQSGKGAAI